MNNVEKTDELDFGMDMGSIMPMFMMIMMMAMIPMLNQQSTTSLQAQEYRGYTDPRNLTVSSPLQWISLITGSPYVGWLSMVIENKGPGSIYIGVNSPDNMVEYLENDIKQTDFSNTNRRIETVFYKSSSGQEASMLVTGAY